MRNIKPWISYATGFVLLPLFAACGQLESRPGIDKPDGGKADEVFRPCRDSWMVADTTKELLDLVIEDKIVAIDDIDDLYYPEGAQIWATVEHLYGSLGDEDFDVVFEIADDGFYKLLIVGSQEDGYYDWVKFYLDDTEVGAVFDRKTLTLVAEVADGKIMGCD